MELWHLRTELQTLLNLLSSVALLVWGAHIVRTGGLRVFDADLRRINSFFCSTAYPILEQAGKLRKSRLMGATGVFPARPDLAPRAGRPPGGDLAGPSK